MLRSTLRAQRVTAHRRAQLATQHTSRRILSTDITRAAQDEIASLIARSRAAQAEIADYTQEQVDDLITAMVFSVCQEDTAKIGTRRPLFCR